MKMLNIGRQTIEVVWLNATLAVRRPKTYDPGGPGVNNIFQKNSSVGNAKFVEK
jgi:hypothetical protein